MFEESVPKPAQSPSPAQLITPAQVLAPEGEPVEFIYKGKRFHIHATLSRWRESGGWWNRIDDGGVAARKYGTSTSSTGAANSINGVADLEALSERALAHFDDGHRAIWRVEAAPEGALATFEIELDEITGSWKIRPTSRPSL